MCVSQVFLRPAGLWTIEDKVAKTPPEIGRRQMARPDAGPAVTLTELQDKREKKRRK